MAGKYVSSTLPVGDKVDRAGEHYSLPAAIPFCCRHTGLFLIAMPGCTPCKYSPMADEFVTAARY